MPVSIKMPSANPSKPLVLRKLGGMESYQAALSSMDLYASTMLTCHYNIPDELTDPTLQDKLASVWGLAVAKVVLAHPMMQVGFKGQDAKKQSYVQIDSIDLSNHIEWRLVSDAEDYAVIRKQTMLEQLDKKYPSPETQPGWSIVILRNMKQNASIDLEVIFAWNHIYFDGTSAKVFHEDLVKSLNTTNKSTDSSLNLQNHTIKTTVKSRKDIPPSQDDLLPFTNTLPYAADLVVKELFPPTIRYALSPSSKALSKNCKAWPPITPLAPPKHARPSFPPKTHFTTLSIDPPTLSHILSACRSHKTTLTALLQAICLISVATQLPASATGTILKSGTAINLRRYAPPSPDPASPTHDPERTMGNIVTKMSHVFGADDAQLLERIRSLGEAAGEEDVDSEGLREILWAAAARVRSELQKRLEMGVKNEAAGLMRVVGDWKGYFRDAVRKPREGSWVVTNVGVLDGGVGGGGRDGGGEENGVGDGSKKWFVRKAYFTLSADVPGPGLAVSCVTVKGGELCVDVSWEKGVVEDGIGERVGVDIERWLRRVGRVDE